MKSLAILGGGGHGKVLADIAEACGWEQIVFFDDRWPELEEIGVWPIVGTSADLLKKCRQFTGVIVAIGDNQIRLDRQRALKACSAPIVSLVHPAACISKYATLGVGSAVMAGAVVNIDSVIGEACILNTGSLVDHDCSLSAGVHVSPGAQLAGNVSVGTCSWLGIGSSVRQQISIGCDVVIGAGAAVVTDIPHDCIAVGVPAKPSQS